MLFLLFQLGNDLYAMDASHVAEVLPLVGIKRIPQSPRGVAGVINYRGTPVPIVDLSALMLGQDAPAHLSTRIILVRHPDIDGGSDLLGLIAENATETIRLEPADFVLTGIEDGATPYLGPVATTARGMIQRIDVGRLLPDSLKELLFKQEAEIQCG